MNEELKNALIDILDGQDEIDLEFFTELTEERCNEIFKIYRKLINE